MNKISLDTVGEVVSSLFTVCLCGLPSAHDMPLMFPFIFCFRKISDDKASLSSSFERSLESIGLKVDMSCICFISFCAVYSPFSPNIFRPALRDIFGIHA